MSWRFLHAIRPRRPWVGFTPPTTPLLPRAAKAISVTLSLYTPRRGQTQLVRPRNEAGLATRGAPTAIKVWSVSSSRPGLVVWARPPLGAPPSVPGGTHLCVTRVYLPRRPHRDGQAVWVNPPIPNPTPGPRLPRIIVPWGNAQAGSRLTQLRQPFTLLVPPTKPTPPVVVPGVIAATLAVFEQLSASASLYEQLKGTVLVED